MSDPLKLARGPVPEGMGQLEFARALIRKSRAARAGFAAGNEKEWREELDAELAVIDQWATKRNRKGKP